MHVGNLHCELLVGAESVVCRVGCLVFMRILCHAGPNGQAKTMCCSPFILYVILRLRITPLPLGGYSRLQPLLSLCLDSLRHRPTAPGLLFRDRSLDACLFWMPSWCVKIQLLVTNQGSCCSHSTRLPRSKSSRAVSRPWLRMLPPRTAPGRERRLRLLQVDNSLSLFRHGCGWSPRAHFRRLRSFRDGSFRDGWGPVREEGGVPRRLPSVSPRPCSPPSLVPSSSRSDPLPLPAP